MAGKCHILAGSLNTERRFPLSRSGYTAAREHVYAGRDRDGAGYATLVCAGTGAIPLYQCYKKQGCAIEGSDGNDVLAGAHRRKRRR